MTYCPSHAQQVAEAVENLTAWRDKIPGECNAEAAHLIDDLDRVTGEVLKDRP